MKATRPLRVLLAGGDRRSVGVSDALARRLISNPKLVDEAILLLSHDDPLIVMRAADALEKASAQTCGVLTRHRAVLLKIMTGTRQQKLVSHFALIAPRLGLSDKEVESVATWLEHVFRTHDSRIARVNALQGLTDLTAFHPGVRPIARRVWASAAGSAVASVAARARKLAKEFAGLF